MAKKIFLVWDINDADYTTSSMEYSEELFEKLKNIKSLDLEEANNFLNEEVSMGFISDMFPHTLVKIYIADVLEEVSLKYVLPEDEDDY